MPAANIIYFEDSSKSVFGGGQIISSFVLSALDKAGCKVTYVDFAPNPILKSCLTESKSHFVLLNHKAAKGLWGKFLSLIFILPNFLKLAFAIPRGQRKIIYTTTKRSLIYGGILGLIWGHPYIYHAHMMPQNKIYDPIILFFIKKAKVCICASDFVHQEFRKLGVANTILLKNPISNEVVFKAKKLHTAQINVAFVGSVIEIKGVMYLLDVLNHDFVTGVTINIFGEGDQLSPLKKAYAGNNNIIFHGFVDNIIDFMDKKIDILVLPTIIPEAGPTIIQLALSRGVPVITTNIGAQQTFVKDGYDGLLVNPQDSYAIAKSIMRIKDNPEKYNQMSHNCTVSAAEFETMKTFNGKLIKIINQLNEGSAVR